MRHCGQTFRHCGRHEAISSKLKAVIIFTFFLIFLPSFAFSISKSELKNLVAKADSEIFFTHTENGYTLLIPEIESSEVQTDLSPLPLGAKLVSSKKENFYDEKGEVSTRIQFWFVFSDAGIAKLPPLTAKIKGKNYYLPFEEVKIYENPNLISPVLSVEFENPAKITKDKNGNETYACRAGEEIRYKVLIQYFSQVLNYSFELPKDSIFEETKRSEIAKNQKAAQNSANKEFTPEKFLLAQYSWKPLKEGDFEIPKISVEAVSYNGSRKNLSLPQILIQVKKSNQNQPVVSMNARGKTSLTLTTATKNPSIFQNAFSAPISRHSADVSASPQRNENSQKKVPTRGECKKLAELRSIEKHSFFSSQAVKNRREFEKSLGIESGENESKNPFSRQKFGVFSGGSISQIPEAKSPSRSFPPARVKITENAAGWLFIENKNFSGWVRAENVFVIE